MAQKSNTIFVHILDYKETLLVIPSSIGKVKKAFWFNDSKNSVRITSKKEGYIINLANSDPDNIDRIIVLEMND